MISEGEKQPLPHNAVSEGGDIYIYTASSLYSTVIWKLSPHDEYRRWDLNPHPVARTGF